MSNNFFSKAHFLANVSHEITGITDVLKKNAHNQNEQTIIWSWWGWAAWDAAWCAFMHMVQSAIR